MEDRRFEDFSHGMAQVTAMFLKKFEPENLFLGRELAKELEREVNKLPPRCQLIYRMIREDGLKYRQVAEALNISLKAVENQMLIAMKRIRSILGDHKMIKLKKKDLLA